MVYDSNTYTHAQHTQKKHTQPTHPRRRTKKEKDMTRREKKEGSYMIPRKDLRIPSFGKLMKLKKWSKPRASRELEVVEEEEEGEGGGRGGGGVWWRGRWCKRVCLRASFHAATWAARRDRCGG
jgi:hypothetical protein